MRSPGFLFEAENYLLAARTIRAAWMVRGWLSGEPREPGIRPTIHAIEKARIPRVNGWRISDYRKILRAAGLAVRFPYGWGACVHQSLITYRLLCGYGIPGSINLGIKKDDSLDSGHAWVTVAGSDFDHHTGTQFRIVYRSDTPSIKSEDR